ncbi:MAG: glycosyltransferase family 2 protein [Nanoarchaeota archaeon]|nr:glycosyltransferase family 2 protein [Nanoarchaeota archaeon]
MEEKKNPLPKISVIVAAYNEEKYILACLNSILDQSFKDFEIIVVNDKSTDKTSEKVKALSEKNEKIFLLEQDTNGGRANALNRGIKKARGKYIAFLDADDLMEEKRLEEQYMFLKDNPKISLVYSNFIQFGNEIDNKFIEAIKFTRDPYKIMRKSFEENLPDTTTPSQILDENKFIPGGSIMMKKSLFEKGIKLDKNLRNSEDYDLWLQIIGKGYKIAKLPIIAFRYRRHKNQKSKNPEKMKLAASHILKKFREGKYFQ